MEEITTYDIIAHAIKKKDPEQWKILRISVYGTHQ